MFGCNRPLLAVGNHHHRQEHNMALLRRELYRQVRGLEVTHADRCALVFDTDTKSLYVEREVAHLDARVGGTMEIQTAAMDIADYLKQGGQTAGHRELWRLLRTLFKDTDDTDQSDRLSFQSWQRSRPSITDKRARAT
jgi:hypothetical protein